MKQNLALMETYILNIQSPFDSLEFVSITNQKTVQFAKNTLLENEGDYLEGSVELSYNVVSIFSKIWTPQTCS
mgnify:FL=1